MLYEALFGRTPAASEVQFWVDYLDKGVTRQFVYQGFANSVEFGNLCSRYGVTQGSFQSSSALDKNLGVTAFVTRMYTVCLKRSGKEAERADWAERLLNQNFTGKDIIYGFFESEELNKKNLSNREFVTRVYQTVFDREPDQSGYSLWVGYLDRGVSRREVLNGFIYSEEFTKLCNRFGITRS